MPLCAAVVKSVLHSALRRNTNWSPRRLALPSLRGYFPEDLELGVLAEFPVILHDGRSVPRAVHVARRGPDGDQGLTEELLEANHRELV
jgi:hypothetical protein